MNASPYNALRPRSGGRARMPIQRVAGAPNAIGGTIGVVLSYSDVEAQYASVKAALDSVQALWASCAAMPGDPINDQWSAERTNVEAYLDAGPSWWFWNWQEEWDTGQAHLTELEAWRQKFAALPACAAGAVPPAIVPTPTPSDDGGLLGGLLGGSSTTNLLLLLAAAYFLSGKGK